MRANQHPILLVDDETRFLLSAEFTLNSEGFSDVITCSDSRKVMDILNDQSVAVIAMDITMPYKTGLDLLPEIAREYPEIPVIMITAINEVDTAVACMRLGAFDYMVKPIDDTRLISTLRRAMEMHQIRHENTRLRNALLSGKLECPEAFDHIITQNPAMHSIFQYIEAVAATPLPILITGETGTGKELIAQAIHNLSGRPGILVPVNVAGVDDQLFSDTLFGHEKGAFTGADRDRKGLIEQANGGTLFLDEIGDLSMESQVKLLRILQEGQYYPLGADRPSRSNARILTATHRDIASMQRDAAFRKDLYYRLKSHHIHLPPLKDRKEDIPLLTDFFLKKAAEKLNKSVPTPPKALHTLLKNHTFPGNIRELEGMLINAVSLHKSGILSLETIRKDVLPIEGSHVPMNADNDTDPPLQFGEHLPTLKESEEALIDEALKRADGNQTLAAQMLGLTRRALNNRLQRAKESF